MSKIISSKSNSSASTQEEETHIITLIQCDYDSFDEDDDENSSQNSIDSSELAEDSDGEIEIITYFRKIKKNLDIIDEYSNEIISA